MGYSIEYNQFIDYYDLGFDFDNEMYNLDLDGFLAYVKQKSETWMNSNIGGGYRQISGYTSPIYSGCFRVALRVGFHDLDGDERLDDNEWMDYHWIYQTNSNSGQWASKSGSTASGTISGSGSMANPANFSVWSTGYGNYSSNIVYYEITDIRNLGW